MEGNKRYLCVTNPLMVQQSTAKPKANVVGCILRSISAYEEGMRELALTKTAVLAEMDERSKSLEGLFNARASDIRRFQNESG